MIKNESVVNNIDNKKLEEFSVDGYHRKCFDEGDHDYIDQSFLKLLEYNTDEFEQNLSNHFLGNHFLDLIYEKDRIVYSDLMSKLKTGEFSGKIQYRIKTKSGKYLVVEENFKSLSTINTEMFQWNISVFFFYQLSCSKNGFGQLFLEFSFCLNCFFSSSCRDS